MSIFPRPLLLLAEQVLDECRAAKIMLATAESCTGGLIAGCLTEVPGSSAVVDRGFVTYTNEAKHEMLGVPGDLLADYGAVSERVARAMAEGALLRSRAQLTVSVTGVAGPGGGTALKPVGLVHFGVAREGRSILHDVQRFGDLSRDEIRLKTVENALRLLLRMV